MNETMNADSLIRSMKMLKDDEYLDQMKVLSLDTDNDLPLSDSEMLAVNFDKFTKTAYCPSIDSSYGEFAQSVDATSFSEDLKTMYLIEFKNGTLKSKEKREITLKAYSTIIALHDLSDDYNMDFFRNNAVFILVYNDDNNPPDRCHHSRACDYIHAAVFTKAKLEDIPCRFETIEHYRKHLFNKSYTYTKSQFKDFLEQKTFYEWQGSLIQHSF